MYRLMLVEDDRNAAQLYLSRISRQYKNDCDLLLVDSAREAIEKAYEWYPDLILMDLQMPGIHGLEAIERIRQIREGIPVIVLSEFEQFDIAKRAIELQVAAYLEKPVAIATLLKEIDRVFCKLEAEREVRQRELDYREKLEQVIPIIESGFIYNILFQASYEGKEAPYRDLLGIQTQYGYLVVLEFGDGEGRGQLTNPVGTSMQMQRFGHVLRQTIQAHYDAIIGPIMSNRVVFFVVYAKAQLTYQERTVILEMARELLSVLKERTGFEYHVGIGGVRPIEDLYTSYQEACLALQNGHDCVVHADDLEGAREEKDAVRERIEHNLYLSLRRRKETEIRKASVNYLEWLCTQSQLSLLELRCKLLELTWNAKRLIRNDEKSFTAQEQTKEWKGLCTCQDEGELRRWFLERIQQLVNAHPEGEAGTFSRTIQRARSYMIAHYQRELSLDEVSKEVEVSPYYFSKLFKEETGENFIEYLTGLRMHHARKLLRDTDKTIKEICVESGYADPNYFSRLFKKEAGVTPSEYRELSSTSLRTK